MKQTTPLYQDTIFKEINCPQCGALLPIRFRWSKLIECPSCHSSIFLEDEGAKLKGKSSTLSPEPSLVQLHEPLIIEGKNYLPLGKIRYSYGRGFWEEWFLQGANNREFWLSIDEGDFVLEHPIEMPLPFRDVGRLLVGDHYMGYQVTEKGKGECVGFSGELPKVVTIGEVHRYLHLSKNGASLITIEYDDDGIELFEGQWIDPFTIKRVQA